MKPSRALLARLIVAAAAIVAALLLWSRRGYIPMWDGRIYADCVIDASQQLLNVGGYRCAGHVSQSYVALLALAQSLAPASPVPMLAMNAALLALAAVAMHRMLRRVFPGDEHPVGRALVLAAFLLHPVVLASVVQPGLDFGMLVFAMCALAAVLEGRRAATVLFGILLVFSKEPGVLVYGVIVLVALWREPLHRVLPTGAFWAAAAALVVLTLLNLASLDAVSALAFLLLLALLLRRRPAAARPRAAAVGAALRGEWTLLVPLVLVFGYLGANAVRGLLAAPPAGHAGAAAPPVVWSGASAGTLVATVFRAGFSDRATLASLALMLVASFMWVPSALALADAGVGAARRIRGLPARPLPGTDGATLALVSAALVGEVWLLSRFVTFSNARYYLPVYPLLLIAGYAALLRLGVSRAFRGTLLAAVAVLFGVSAVRTVDPLSRALWGTFPAGDRSMLVVTSLTGECCGAGRDQLVYNLEFTRLDQVMSDALARLRPDDSTTIVLPVLGDWYTVGPLDSLTRRRTLARTGIVTPRTMLAPTVYYAPHPAPQAWYLELTYLDNSVSLERLSERYDVGAPLWAVHGGYAMGIRRLQLRAAPLARLATDGPSAVTGSGARP